MVSTRGLKFKFTEGEKVLCYEPDPTKAKVLYDSKVLELNVNRDSRGRKVPEYLIHFYGWSSSWDRCVKEEFILPDTEDNRNLQNRLAEEAALCLKNRRKSKIPPIIKETLAKKDSSEGNKEMPANAKEQAAQKSSSESESSDDEVDKMVVLDIPQPLKAILNKDQKFIKQENKLIKLPCKQNVILILEAFVKQFAIELLDSPAHKHSRNGKDISRQEAEVKIGFCKEVMDGVRNCFDFTLAHLLLYNNEKKQYYTIENSCVPVCWGKSEVKNETKHVPENIDVGPLSCFVHLQKETKALLSCSPPPTATRLRNHSSNQNHLVTQDDNSKQKSSTGRSSTNKEASSGGRKTRSMGSRKGLRSSDRQKNGDENSNSNTSGIADSTSTANNITSLSIEPPQTPTSPSRQTRRSSQNLSPSHSTSVPTTRSPSSQKKLMNINPTNIVLNQPVVSLQSSLPVCVKNVPVVQSSSVPAVSSSKTDMPPPQPDPKSGLLKEISAWRMLPKHIYEQVPAAPTLIYGSHHLLRLFVKLPQLIYRMNIPRRSLASLVGILENFLQYLVENKDTLFQNSFYIDCNEDGVE